jgi:hypothetical protein
VSRVFPNRGKKEKRKINAVFETRKKNKQNSFPPSPPLFDKSKEGTNNIRKDHPQE